MPIYDYACKRCHRETGVLRRIGDNAPPLATEVPDELVLCDMDDSGSHEWQRILSRTHMDRGPNWNYRKPT